MKIVYRVSEYAPVKSTGNANRYLSYSKAEIQRVCFKSLQSDDEIIYVADKVSDSFMEHMQASRPGKIVDVFEKVQHENLHPVSFNSCITYVNTIMSLAKENPEELIYACEDDYLHLPGALEQIRKHTGEFWYVPYSCPQWYNLSIASLFWIDEDLYRIAPGATFTICAKGKRWLERYHAIKQAALFSSDLWTSCVTPISPVVPLVCHVQNGCHTEPTKWKKIFEDYLSKTT